MEITVNGEIGNLFRTYSMYKQSAYEDLVNNPDTKMFGDERAAVFLAHEFGFVFEKIRILRELPLMVLCGSNLWKRSSVMVKRMPAYNSSDWNYMLFRVNKYVYELTNGHLYIVDIEVAE